MYDLIGDIHGHADDLAQFLESLERHRWQDYEWWHERVVEKNRERWPDAPGSP
jgi:hypothetical protein